IVDYHHDLRSFSGEGLVLYPHFFPEVIPGWFDKAFKGRRPAEADFDRVLLITPSQEFISTLPNGKIPDRKDFSRMETDERITTWRRTLSETDALAEELASVLERNEPEAALEPAPA
ncbi:MAG: patatin-like phospholipase family protein, partial [Myxococcota bacterium]